MALDRDLALLTGVPFFEGISADALKVLVFSADPRDFAIHDRIFSAGDVAEGGLLVIEGTVELVDERARPPKVVESVGPGGLIGELALITETRRPRTAIAATPVKALSIRRALFRRMLEGYPEIAGLLHDRLATRLTTISPDLGRIADRMEAIDRG